MQNTVVLQTIEQLIAEGKQVVHTKYDAGNPQVSYMGGRPTGVDLQQFAKWHGGCVNLIRMLGTCAEPWALYFNPPKKNDLAIATRMLGTLEAIREAVQNGLLLTVEELIRAEAFNSLLEQGEYLLSEGYFLAAGVLGRAVFEEHLREWCALRGCAPAKPKPTLNDYKDSLYKAKHISVTVMKHFEAIASVGNEAAHNTPTLDRDAVARMLRDVRDVLVKHPLV